MPVRIIARPIELLAREWLAEDEVVADPPELPIRLPGIPPSRRFRESIPQLTRIVH